MEGREGTEQEEVRRKGTWKGRERNVGSTEEKGGRVDRGKEKGGRKGREKGAEKVGARKEQKDQNRCCQDLGLPWYAYVHKCQGQFSQQVQL